MIDNAEGTADGSGSEEDNYPDFISCLYYTESTDDEGRGTDNDALPSMVCVKSPIKKAKLEQDFNLCLCKGRKNGKGTWNGWTKSFVKLRAERRTMCTRDWRHSFKGTSLFPSPYQNSENTAVATSCTDIHGQ